MAKHWVAFLAGCIALCVTILLNIDTKPQRLSNDGAASWKEAQLGEHVVNKTTESLSPPDRSATPRSMLSQSRQLGVLTSGLGWWFQCTTSHFHLAVDDHVFHDARRPDASLSIKDIIRRLVVAGRSAAAQLIPRYGRSSGARLRSPVAYHEVNHNSSTSLAGDGGGAAAVSSPNLFCSTNYAFHAILPPDSILTQVEWVLLEKAASVSLESAAELGSSENSVEVDELLSPLVSCTCEPFPTCCAPNSVASPVWTIWFRLVFVPAYLHVFYHDRDVLIGLMELFQKYWLTSVNDERMNKSTYSSSKPTLLELVRLASKEVPDIAASCTNMALDAAPWCSNLATDGMNSWLLVEPPAPRVFVPLVVKQSEDSSAFDNITASPAGIDQMINSSSQTNTTGRLSVSAMRLRRSYLRNLTIGNVKRIFASASPPEHVAADGSENNASPSPQLLSDEDEKMVRDIVWSPFPQGGEQLLHTADEGASGTFYFRNVNTRYPVQLALYNLTSTQAAKSPSRSSTAPSAASRTVPGFHLCLYGPFRNISATLPVIKANFIDTMRPERIHIVTSDYGHEDHLPADAFATTYDMPSRRGMKPTPRRVNNATKEETAAARDAYFRYNLDVFARLGVELASFIAVVDGLPLRLNGCKVCRGAFAKEMCRVAIVSDVKRSQRPAGLVFVTRPDAVPRAPLNLEVHVDDGAAARGGRDAGRVDRAGVPLGSYRRHIEDELKSSDGTTSYGNQSQSFNYRLYSTPTFSIVPDRGMAPAAMGVINDYNLSRTSVLVHTRVTFSLDLSWIADPVLLGHWSVLQHWLMQFSIMSSSPVTTPWREAIAGERNQFAFFSTYIRPLFLLAASESRHHGAASAAQDHRRREVSVHVFDFMVTLFRNVPAIDKHLFDLPINYAAYQEMTINRKHPTKFFRAGCMKYTFHQQYDGVASYYDPKSSQTTFWGAIGRMTFRPRPMWQCQQLNSVPGLPTCFPQFDLATVPTTFKGKRIVLPCTPFCNVLSILHPEGLCLFVGQKEHRSKHYAALSLTPMTRSYETGEVMRFNVVFPQKVLRAGNSGAAAVEGDSNQSLTKMSFPRFRGSA